MMESFKLTSIKTPNIQSNSIGKLYIKKLTKRNLGHWLRTGSIWTTIVQFSRGKRKNKGKRTKNKDK